MWYNIYGVMTKTNFCSVGDSDSNGAGVGDGGDVGVGA